MKIYVAKNRVRYGPFILSELNEKVANGEFGGNDFASIEGSPWVKVSEVGGIVLPPANSLTEASQVNDDSWKSDASKESPKRKVLFKKTPEMQAYRIHFGGNGYEFFKIWIVNLLLTIITLGIYSAWAKVRTINYFYGNTSLDNSSFSFVANPISILKGRIIAFALFGLYTFFQTAQPFVSLIIMLAVFPLIPLLVVRSMRFRMQNTEYRGLKFNFTGSVGHAYSIFFGGVILTYITLGILFPWWACQKKQYLLGNLRYGNKRFESFPQNGAFYKCAGICILMGFATLVLVFLLRYAAVSVFGEHAGIAIVLFLYISMGITSAFWYVSTTNHTMEATNLPGVFFKSCMTTHDYVVLWVVNIILLVLTLGFATPWVMVRNARYRINCTTVLAENLGSFVEGQIESTSALGEELGETIDLDIGL